MSTAELACIYSSLILCDDNIAITADKIATLLKAAKIDIEQFWAVLYSKALNNVDVKELITNLSSGVGAAPASAAPAATSAASSEAPAADKKEKKEEAKKEESEESDADMGFGLFD